MWSNRWVRVGAVALGFFLINGISRLISLLVGPSKDAVTSASQTGNNTLTTVIAVVGALLTVALLGVAGAYWAVRFPVVRMVGDLALAILGGTVLATLVGPFFGNNRPFDGGVETFVVDFLQFLGLGALGVFLGFVAMVVLGKDWRSRGLAAYTQRYEKRVRAAAAVGRKRSAASGGK
jgi:hypothetical protein